MPKPPSVAALREIFGLNVRLERTRQKLTQEQLAGQIGTDQSFLSQVERGLTAASLDSVERIARALGVSPTALLDERLGRR